MDSLTPAKKAQLKEVADLVLEIYRTLVRMRYLDALWISEGPHDIEALLPMYRSYVLDDSVIYLYSILSYIDAASATYLDFFQGGEFADFRKEEDVKQGRDPFYKEDEDNQLPTYMTPLSLLGNHRSVIFYNSRKHWVAIIDQEYEGTTDHNIDEGRIPIDEDDEDAARDQDIGKGEEGGGEEDGVDEDEDKDDDSDDEGRSWDELTSRPAGNVLRDIVRWYHELVETPGGGEQSAQFGGRWYAEILKPLYRKHGWPDSHFDGDGFLVDLARADAAETAESSFTGEGNLLNARLKLDGPDGLNSERMKKAEAVAETAEDLWLARWHLWFMELDARRNTEALRRAGKIWDDARRKDLPLNEVENLKLLLQVGEDRLEEAQQGLRDAEAGDLKDVPGARTRLQYAEKQVGVVQKAYDASRADADILLSDRTSTPDPRALEISGYKGKVQQLTRDVEEYLAGDFNDSQLDFPAAGGYY